MLDYIQDRPLVFLDVETTGSSPSNSRILEIGALRVENGKVVKQINQVLDPEEPVPPWITDLTGIHEQETYGQPVFAAMLGELEHLLSDAIFIAHNVSFDYSFMRSEYSKLGRSFDMDRLCTVRLSRALYPKERSHRLDAVISRHGYEVTNRHRAYDDAEVLHKFYYDSLLQFGSDYFYGITKSLTQPSNLSV